MALGSGPGSQLLWLRLWWTQREDVRFQCVLLVGLAEIDAGVDERVWESENQAGTWSKESKELTWVMAEQRFTQFLSTGPVHFCPFQYS